MTNQRYRNTYIDGCSHFCTASIIEKLELLRDEQACVLIAKSWKRWRRKYNILIEGYVIMYDHIHLLIRGSADGVQRFMQQSLSQSSREIRILLKRKARGGDREAAGYLETVISRANGGVEGKVWKDRFRCIALDREDAVLEKLQYIHNNPVKKGYVEMAEDWKWSSCSAYHGVDGPVPVDLIRSCGSLSK